MFDGMSTVNEYWKRARSIENSDSESISSECSFKDSNYSSSKEYCDVSCNVDFDDETDEPPEENLTDLTDRLTNNVPIASKCQPDDDKLSRYVRWDVLMALGVGLWIFLCIVDVLHSEKSMTKEWLYGFVWQRKIMSKVELPKKIENPVVWYSSLSSHLWKIVSLVTSGGAYVLFFLLMIVFCVDPMLRNIGACPVKNVSQKVSVAKSKDSSIEDKSLVVEKRVNEEKSSKIVTVRLELVPSLNLQKKFLSPIEKCIQVDLKKVDLPIEFSCPSEMRVTKICDSDRQESVAGLSLRRELVNLLDAKYRATLRYSSVRSGWPSITKIEAIVKDSTSLCLVDARKKSELNNNASTFDLEIGEYLMRTRQSLRTVFYACSHQGNHEMRHFVKAKLEDSAKTRIITSSPAFKKFLSSYQYNSAVS